MTRDSRYHETSHNDDILSRLLDKEQRGKKNEDDVEAKHHGEQLSLQGCEVEALDDDSLKGAQTTRREWCRSK